MDKIEQIVKKISSNSSSAINIKKFSITDQTEKSYKSISGRFIKKSDILNVWCKIRIDEDTQDLQVILSIYCDAKDRIKAINIIDEFAQDKIEILLKNIEVVQDKLQTQKVK